MSPCVLNNHTCSLETRKQSKLKHKQTFNSILQMGDSYFKTRGLGEDFRTNRTMTEFKMNRVNIEEATPTENQKAGHRSGGADRRDSLQSGEKTGRAASKSKGPSFDKVDSSGNPVMDKMRAALALLVQAQKSEILKGKSGKSPKKLMETLGKQTNKSPGKFSKTFEKMMNDTKQSTAADAFRAPRPVPNLETGMGAPYLGSYAKTFQASSLDGNYKTKSTAATNQY